MKKKIMWHGCQRSVSRITQYSNEEHHCCIYEELSAQMICVHQIRCHKKKRSDGLGHAAYMHACHSSHLHSHACHVTFPYNMHSPRTTSHHTPHRLTTSRYLVTVTHDPIKVRAHVHKSGCKQCGWTIWYAPVCASIAAFACSNGNKSSNLSAQQPAWALPAKFEAQNMLWKVFRLLHFFQ
jgi:hypothetical protein